jgi:hypothetical protein
MSMGYRGRTTNRFAEVSAVIGGAEVESKYHEIPGEIISFDPATQTASVQPLFELKVGADFLPLPQLDEVPVRFARAGFGGLTFPVQVGDKVTLRPQTRSTEEYHTEGVGQPRDARFSSLSDMEAHLDGGESLQEPIENFDAANTHLRVDPAGSYGLKGSSSGQFAIIGSAGELYDLLATGFEKLGTDLLLIKYGSSAGTGHELLFKADYAQIGAKLRSMTLT